METTVFEMLVLPVILTTTKVLFACWLVSQVARWASRIATALSGHADAVERPLATRPTAPGSAWYWHDAVAILGVKSRREIKRKYRGRLAS